MFCIMLFQVIFDSDPAPIGRPVPTQLEEMSQAMIRYGISPSFSKTVTYLTILESQIYCDDTKANSK